ncbi:MAG TPA: hypothetical protein VH916_12860 [Dehalococcoidia bacterium]
MTQPIEAGRSRPQFLWGLFCDHFLIDAAGKYSFIGVFERIGAMSFPAVHKAMWIAFALRGAPHERAMGVVTVWSPQSEILISTNETPVQFGPEGRAMFVQLFYDLSFPATGTYSVVLEVGGKPVGRLDLEVYTATPPAPPA